MSEKGGGVSFIGGVREKIDQKVHPSDDHYASSDSDEDSPRTSISSAARVLGRKPTVHSILGGGKSADILLWRNKKISAGILGGVTLIWVLFECLEYHLLTLISHGLILTLAILFLWSNANCFIRKSPPKIPMFKIPEEVVKSIFISLMCELNRLFTVLREVALGRDLKKFLGVIVGLWVLSVVGSWFNFVTVLYIVFLTMHTVPPLYEKYEHQIDSAAEKALMEMKTQYAVFDAKVLRRIAMGPLMKLKKN